MHNERSYGITKAHGSTRLSAARFLTLSSEWDR